MPAQDVLTLLDALSTAGVPVWLDGGWGVDALLGEQTRPHGDVDVVMSLDDVPAAVHALAILGFGVAEDYLPTRLVLRAPGGRAVDVHPVSFDSTGDGWQAAANPDGSDCRYPADGFTSGSVDGQEVGCLSPRVQVAHHTGYVPRPHDRLDVARLAERFGLPLPEAYR